MSNWEKTSGQTQALSAALGTPQLLEEKGLGVSTSLLLAGLLTSCPHVRMKKVSTKGKITAFKIIKKEGHHRTLTIFLPLFISSCLASSLLTSAVNPLQATDPVSSHSQPQLRLIQFITCNFFFPPSKRLVY